MTELLLDKYLTKIENTDFISHSGKVTGVTGLIIEARGLHAAIGEVCNLINNNNAHESIKTEVVGFKGDNTLLMPLGSMDGISPDTEVITTGKPLEIPVGNNLLGRVLDGLGNPIDDKGPLLSSENRCVYNVAPHPLKRSRVKEVLPTGIKAIDGFLTCGKGQRVGIFSGSGIGKSTLLGMIARYCKADINIIGLTGERGREVKDFIEKDLKEGLSKSVVVVSTSEQPALIRLKGAFTATTIAEYFRDKGYNVLLLLDSITRIAIAQREIGLSIGEPPTTKGFTPSVFALLPKLLERSGMSDTGSITGFYTVLVEQGDMDEPISDAVRAILDGHIVLSRKLAHANHYPAIDILSSISRLMIDIVPKEHNNAAKSTRDILALHKETEDLINIGAYVRHSNPKIDHAIDMIDKINDFAEQEIDSKTEYKQTVQQLIELSKSA
ncbi:MAG: flagellar protein export ATPase FliI [bacterium]|nr:flagellar protein export ATPase FliI [bacterium]